MLKKLIISSAILSLASSLAFAEVCPPTAQCEKVPGSDTVKCYTVSGPWQFQASLETPPKEGIYKFSSASYNKFNESGPANCNYILDPKDIMTTVIFGTSGLKNAPPLIGNGWKPFLNSMICDSSSPYVCPFIKG